MWPTIAVALARLKDRELDARAWTGLAQALGDPVNGEVERQTLLLGSVLSGGVEVDRLPMYRIAAGASVGHSTIRYELGATAYTSLLAGVLDALDTGGSQAAAS